MPKRPSRIDLLELDIDLRLADLWRETADVSEWNLEVVAAFMRASNAIYDVDEGRPIWKTGPVRLLTTVALVVMLVIAAAIVVLTGPIANQVGTAFGIGHAAVLIWDIAKWPVLLIIVILMISILYWVAPNAKRGFQWVSPGGVLAVVAWLVASGFILSAATITVRESPCGSYRYTKRKFWLRLRRQLLKCSR